MRNAFAKTLNMYATRLERILVLALTSAEDLDQLGELLSTIRTLTREEQAALINDSGSVLWRIWITLSGDHEKLHTLQGRMEVLRDLDNYRKDAATYVAGTTHVLSRALADISNMRDRLQRTQLDDEEVPVGVQLISLEQSIRRFRTDDQKALRGGDGRVGGVAMRRAG